MIRDQWYVILESKEVRPGKPVGVLRMGEKLVLWRSPDGRVSCAVDRCPHLGAALSQGKLHENRLACPFHGFEFDPGGQCCYIPAIGQNGVPPKAMQLSAYPVHEAHGFIWIWWGNPNDNLPAPHFFDGINSSFSHTGYQDPWPVHYSRMVENQLDVLHLPFVHHNTIGRGQRTVVDGPLYQLHDDLLQIWVYNRADDGTPPRQPEELPPPQRPPFLEFIFPNLWQNRISEDLRLVVAFVPVDEEHSIMVLRQYQRMVTAPILRALFNWAGMLGNRYIVNQDKRVVSRQTPKKTGLRMGEKPIPGDRIIIAYRRRRKELQEQADK